MENQNNNRGLIALLIVIIVILSALCILLATGTISFKSNDVDNNETNQNVNMNDNDNKFEYDYKSIKGLYKYTSETMKDENGNEYEASYNLYLYDNGTFNYRMATMVPYGYMGNYIIEDNTIVLNYLFETNSGAGIDVTTGTKKITITDENTLVDVNQSISIVNMTSVTLEKATSAEENEFLQGNDFSNILKNYHITNNVPNN